MGLEDRKQTRDIDGFTYEVNPLPFGVGRKTLMRVKDIISPVIAALYGQQGNAAVGSAIAALPDALSDDDLVVLAKAFGGASWYLDGDKRVPLLEVNQELHFAGRYLAFLQWLIFSLEVNYASFFAGMGSGLTAKGLTDLVNPKP